MRNFLILFGACLLCLQWPLLAHGADLSLVMATILPGIAICGAAFLLSWGSEVAQLDIPQSLAFAFVALVAVLPEYAVDLYFAWMAGKDPSYAPYAIANMTGANRILIGVGWAGLSLIYWLRSRKKTIFLNRSHQIELIALMFATLYSFMLPLKGQLDISDTVVLLAIFAFYLIKASKSHHEEPEFDKGVAHMLSTLGQTPRRLAVLVLFIIAGVGIFSASEPFAEGLLELGGHYGIDRFLLVQWLAPIASESPEFLIAAIFAWRLKPTAGLATLVSSKVNQWTLLVGMLPVAYSISSGQLSVMHFDMRQVEEVFLTAAQSLFALVMILNLSFSLWEALALFGLFTLQLFFPSMHARYLFGILYIVLSIFIVLKSPEHRKQFVQTFDVFKRKRI